MWKLCLASFCSLLFLEKKKVQFRQVYRNEEMDHLFSVAEYCVNKFHCYTCFESISCLVVSLKGISWRTLVVLLKGISCKTSFTFKLVHIIPTPPFPLCNIFFFFLNLERTHIIRKWNLYNFSICVFLSPNSQEIYGKELERTVPEIWSSQAGKFNVRNGKKNWILYLISCKPIWVWGDSGESSWKL